MKNYNSCTVSCVSLGNIWGHAGKSRPTVTVYVHLARYTSEFLKNSDTSTVSFYPENCKRAWAIMVPITAEMAIKLLVLG